VFRFGNGVDLTDRASANLVDLLEEEGWIAERQKEGPHTDRSEALDEVGLVLHSPGDESDTDVGMVGYRELSFNPGEVAVAAADQSESPG